jgi:PKD repeat protein
MFIGNSAYSLVVCRRIVYVCLMGLIPLIASCFNSSSTPLDAQFTTSRTTASLTTQFTDTSQGNVSAWVWDFGDGSAVDNTQNPTHTYPDAGSYVVTLHITDSGGAADQTAQRVTVYVLPVADFTYTADTTDPQNLHWQGAAAQVYATPLGGSPPTPSITQWLWDFGDGNNAGGQSATHRYAQQGSYTVTLQTTGPGGTNTSTETIVAGNAAPAALFTFNPVALDVQQLHFTDQSTGQITSWHWDLGDNTTSTQNNPQHTYQRGGDYSVTLTLTGPGGTHSYSETVTVAHRLPVPSISYAPSTLANPLVINFTASATGVVTDWEWDFGDSSSSSLQQPGHSYTAAGAYTVTLRAIGPGGQAVTSTVLNLGITSPTIDFNYAQGAGLYEATFTPLVGGTAAVLDVQLGDGNTQTLNTHTPTSPAFGTIRHQYQSAATYPVTMTLSGPAGTASVTKNITISEPTLTADFTVSPTANVPLSFDFDSAASGNVRDWQWDFGDSQSGVGEDVSHVYQANGNYPVMLTVTGPGGSASRTINVNVSSGQPLAIATAIPPIGNTPLTVLFDNQSQGSWPLSYLWDFGDGNSATDSDPAHTYQQPGNYTVDLTVTDSASPPQTSNTSLIVGVQALALNAKINTSRRSGEVPLTVLANDDSDGTINRWRWDFGDGSAVVSTTDPNQGRHQSHTYSSPGRYILSLTVGGPLSPPAHEDTQTVEVIVTPAQPAVPTLAKIHALPVVGSSPLTVNFSDMSQGVYASVFWDFGDGSTSTDANPSHTFNNDGQYSVSLTLLGPTPTQLPLSTTAEVVSVNAQAEPGIGPPMDGSLGGVSSPALPRPNPGSSGGSGPGSTATPLPGSSGAQPGPGWFQSSIVRYEPTAGLSFSDNYRLLRTSGGGQFSTPVDCGSACTTQNCGLLLPSAHASATREVLSVSAVSTAAGTAYLAVTEREEVTPQPNVEERFSTTISTLSVGSTLSVSQRVVLEPTLFLDRLSPALPTSSAYYQQNKSSFVVDDLMVLANGTLVTVGRIRAHYNYGGNTPDQVDELPGLFAFSPSNGNLLWSLQGEWVQSPGYDSTEVRASFIDDRFLLWVMRAEGYSATHLDATLYEGKVPNNNQHLQARVVADRINNHNLVDYAVGPDNKLFLVVREESPLACLDETLDNYQLRVFNSNFSQEVAQPTPLDLDYNPRVATRYSRPIFRSERRLLVERDNQNVRVILHGAVWPDDKNRCYLYKGSAAHLNPAFTGSHCPASIIKEFCCDDPAVAALHGATCAGANDKGACPCIGMDSTARYCTRRSTPNEVCERPNSPFALEQVLLKPSPAGLENNADRHRVIALPAGGLQPSDGSVVSQFVHPFSLSSDGQGRVTYHNQVIKLDDAHHPDIEFPKSRYETSVGAVLTDRSTPRRSIHGVVGAFKVYRHDAGAGLNTEESWAWPFYSNSQVIIPAGNSRLLTLGRSTSSGGILARLYAPSSQWPGPLFTDHASGSATISLCQDSANQCGAYAFFPGEHPEIEPGYSRCRRWNDSECRAKFLDWWEYKRSHSRIRRIPYIRSRLLVKSSASEWPESLSQIMVQSPRLLPDPVQLRYIQPRCGQISEQVQDTRTVCIDYDSARNVCRRTEQQDRMGYRCDDQNEVLLPILVSGNYTARGWERYYLNAAPTDCSEVGLSSPVLTLTHPGATFQVSQNSTATAGTVSATLPSQGDVNFKIISGDAELGNGTREQLFTGTRNAAVSVQAKESMTAVVEVKWTDPNTRREKIRNVALTFARQGLACKTESGGFRACTLPHPGPVLAEEDQPARHAPAFVASDVDLATKAFWPTEVDIEIPSIDLPLTIARHYIPPRQPTVASPDPSFRPLSEGAELGPGWRLNLIQWLLPITPGTEQSAIEPANGFDMALHADGRVERFKYPGAGGVNVTWGDERLFLYQQSTGSLQQHAMNARVVTYDSPAGYQGTLRGYTLIPAAGGRASDQHPFFDSTRSEVGPDEERFFVLTDKGGLMRVFNCKGQLLRMISPRYHSMQFFYQGPRDPTTNLPVLSGVVDTNGRLTKIDWLHRSTGPKIREIILPLGRRIEFNYRATSRNASRLTAVIRNFDAREPLSTSVNPSPIDPAIRLRHGYGYGGNDLLKYRFVQQGNRQVVVLRNGYEGQDLVRQETGAGRNNVSGSLSQDGGVTHIAYNTNNTVVTDAIGSLWTHELTALPGTHSAKVISATTTSVEVFNNSVPNPANANQDLSTRYEHGALGKITKVDPPGPSSMETVYNLQGDITQRKEVGGSDERIWNWTYDYEGACMRRQTQTDPGTAMTVTHFYPFDTSRPGQYCEVSRITLPAVSDPDGTVHNYKKTFEYYGADLNASNEHRLLRGMVSRSVHADANTDVQQTEISYWAQRGWAASMAGHTAYTKLGLPKVTTVSGPVPTQCSGDVTAERETYQEYDNRGNLTLIRHWSIDPSNPEQTPAQITDASEEVRVYDQADRLFSVNQNGVSTEFTYNDRGQVTEVSSDAQDLFNGAALNHPIPNSNHQKTVKRFLYLHSGERFATLFGHRSGTADPEFYSFSFSAYDGLGREIVTVNPAGGIQDADRYSVLSALLNACPGQRTPDTGPNCAAAALSGTGWNSLTVPSSTLNTTGAPYKIERSTYTADGLLSTLQTHNGMQGIDGSGGQLSRSFYDEARNLRLSESGATSQSGEPIRTENEFNAFGETDSTVLYDPGGCSAGASGMTEVQRQRFQNRDGMGRPRTITTFGDDGNVVDVRAENISASNCNVATELDRIESTFDAMGRVRTETQHVHVINGHGNSQSIESKYTYGALGDLVQFQQGTRLERTYVDYAGATCASDVATSSGQVFKQVDYTLDGLARITRATVRHKDIDGHGLGEPNQTLEFAYNAQGLRSLYRDGIKRATRFHYDALGRTRIEESFNDIDQQTQQKEVRYDNRGNPFNEFTLTDDGRRGLWRSFVSNQLVEETTTVDSAWRSRRRFVLDHQGRPIRIYPHGLDDEVIIRELDSTGRIKNETLSINGQHRTQKVFTYDALDNVTSLSATELSQTRDTAWDETKRYRFNGLGHLTHAQNAIQDPRSSSAARNGVVSNVWSVRDTLGKARVEGTKLFDRGVNVTERENVVHADFDAKGQMTRVEYDDGIHRRNRPILLFDYDNGHRLKAIRGDAGLVINRFEFKHSGDFIKRRQWFDAGSRARHQTDYSFDRLLRPYKVAHRLDRVRLESRQWYRNGMPAWTSNVSYRFDGGHWIANADNNLLAYPENQCSGAPGARIQGTGRKAVAELTADSCFNADNNVRVMGQSGWDVVRQTGAVGSSFTGTLRDRLGREKQSTTTRYAGPTASRAAPSVTRRWVDRREGRIAKEQSVEIGAKVNSSLISGDTYEWGLRAITKHQHAYEGLPLFSGIVCDNQSAGLDTSTFRRLCATREYRFVEPPLDRFPGPNKPFDAINLSSDWSLEELKRDQLAGVTANPPTSPAGPDQARYEHRYGLLGGPVQVSDSITHVNKYNIEYDLFGRQVSVRDNHFLSGAGPRQASHRFLYDAKDRLIYEDYTGVPLANDDITYAPTFYGYYGKDLVREHVFHPDNSEPSDRVYVYGPGSQLLYTARMGAHWNPNYQPPIAHVTLEDITKGNLSLYYQHGADRGYHEVIGEIAQSKVRHYITGVSALPGVPAIKEPYKQLSSQMRASPFEGMIYSTQSGFHRSRKASWRTHEWLAQEITVNEWLQQERIARMKFYGILAAPVVIATVAFAPPSIMLGVGVTVGAARAYHLVGHVQDEGWTDENMTEAGWIAWGVAADVATVGGYRYVTVGKVAMGMAGVEMAYQIPKIADSLGDNCFVAGTPVWTENGLVSIEHLQLGQKVWTWNESTGEEELKPVLQTFNNTSEQFIVINIEGEQIQTTPEHPFWVDSIGWVNAQDLENGQQLGSLAGKYAITLLPTSASHTVATYNIDVADNDNYFVGHSRVLAHNSSGGGKIIAKIGRAVPASVPPALATETSLLRALRAEFGEAIYLAHKAGITRFRGGRYTGVYVHAQRMRHAWDNGLLDPRTVDAIMALPSRSPFRRSFLRRFRAGHRHEMLMVRNVPTLYRQGFKMDDIREMFTLPTRGLTVGGYNRKGELFVGHHTGTRAGTWVHKRLYQAQTQAQSRFHMEQITLAFHRRLFKSAPDEIVKKGVLLKLPDPL